MKKILLSSIFLLFTFYISAQNNGLLIEWEKTYGGKTDDKANSIIQISDGGYVLAGKTESKGNGYSDFWVIKFDKSGNEIWDKTFGGASYDEANSIIQTEDGGYAVAGYTYSNGLGNYDSWVIKLDQNGNKIWDKNFGGASYDVANSIIQTKNGEFVVAGYTNSKGAGAYDFWIIKLDKNGNKKWDKTFGDYKNDVANSIVQTTDSGYAVAGYTNSKGEGGADFFIIKLDKNGNKKWDKTFGGKINDLARSIIQTTDNGYAVAGITKSKGSGNYDFWIIKFDGNGSKKWDKTFGGNMNDIANSIIQTTEGGYAVAGYTESEGLGERDFWIIELDQNGKKKWGKTFGGCKDDEAHSIVQTASGEYAIAGETYSKGAGGSDFWIIKLIGNSINDKIKLHVINRIKAWQQKGEFEKTETYKKRVNENTRNKAAQEFAMEALPVLKREEAKKYKKNDFTLDKYDADNETFLIKSEHGNIVLPVEISDAPAFKSKWNNVEIKNLDFTLSDNKFVLSKLQFYNPVDNKAYVFDSKKASTYDLEKIEYNFGEINYDSPVKKQKYVNNSKIVKTDTKVGKSDIDINIPKTNFDNKNTFAVIIGNENYKNEQKVEYAINDAKSFNNYAIKTLNIPKAQVHFVKDATYGSLLSEFDWINQVSEAYKGDAKIIFYYAGHGMPDDETKDAYLLPVDGYSTNTKSAVKLDDMYNSFTQYPAKSVTVFLDACFSGDARNGMLTAGRGVKIRPKNNILKGKLVVFSAVSGKETAHPYKEKQHGMFTYFLLKEIQATKGDITYSQLKNYIKDNVYKKSVVLGNPQSPQANVSDEVKDVWQDWKFNQ